MTTPSLAMLRQSTYINNKSNYGRQESTILPTQRDQYSSLRKKGSKSVPNILLLPNSGDEEDQVQPESDRYVVRQFIQGREDQFETPIYPGNKCKKICFRDQVSKQKGLEDVFYIPPVKKEEQPQTFCCQLQ